MLKPLVQGAIDQVRMDETVAADLIGTLLEPAWFSAWPMPEDHSVVGA